MASIGRLIKSQEIVEFAKKKHQERGRERDGETEKLWYNHPTIDENQGKMQIIHFSSRLQRYQVMRGFKDNKLWKPTARITFRFGFFSSIELTNSELYLIYWHGERCFEEPARFVRISFGTWCTSNDVADGHTIWRWLASRILRKIKLLLKGFVENARNFFVTSSELEGTESDDRSMSSQWFFHVKILLSRVRCVLKSIYKIKNYRIVYTNRSSELENYCGRLWLTSGKVVNKIWIFKTRYTSIFFGNFTKLVEKREERFKFAINVDCALPHKC